MVLHSILPLFVFQMTFLFVLTNISVTERSEYKQERKAPQPPQNSQNEDPENKDKTQSQCVFMCFYDKTESAQ